MSSQKVAVKSKPNNLIAGMPCGTRVSLALFAGVSVAALYTPIEVCANYAAIKDTIDHLDWRTAWSGNSRIRESMLSVARLLRSLPEPAQVVMFTDGEEAPRLHAFNTRDLTNFQGGNDWLLVGVGNEKGTAIPKYDEKNQLIGYWANDSFAMQPGIAQISEQILSCGPHFPRMASKVHPAPAPTPNTIAHSGADAIVIPGAAHTLNASPPTAMPHATPVPSAAAKQSNSSCLHASIQFS